MLIKCLVVIKCLEIKLSNILISVLESGITLFWHQTCRGYLLLSHIPQLRLVYIYVTCIFITFSENHTYMLNILTNSFAYLNHFSELIYIRVGGLLRVSVGHLENIPFLKLSFFSQRPTKMFLLFECTPAMWSGQDIPSYQHCSGSSL